MTRIEREKQIVTKMIALYCRHRHGQQQMSEKYRSLADYACQRLEHCRYGEKKPACSDCPTHCYALMEREAIREVMRWTGPRMMLYAPKDAIIHMFHKLKHWLQSLSYRTGASCCSAAYFFIYCRLPRCCYPSAQRLRECCGRYSSDWPRPASMVA